MNKFLSEDEYGIEEVRDEYSSAAVIEPVDGGWMIFDSATDYELWLDQE